MYMSVCLSLCVRVSVRKHISGTTSPFFTYFVHVTVAVARCSSGGVVIRHVLAVLRTTSCLHIMTRTTLVSGG